MNSGTAIGDVCKNNYAIRITYTDGVAKWSASGSRHMAPMPKSIGSCRALQQDQTPKDLDIDPLALLWCEVWGEVGWCGVRSPLPVVCGSRVWGCCGGLGGVWVEDTPRSMWRWTGERTGCRVGNWRWKLVGLGCSGLVAVSRWTAPQAPATSPGAAHCAGSRTPWLRHSGGTSGNAVVLVVVVVVVVIICSCSCSCSCKETYLIVVNASRLRSGAPHMPTASFCRGLCFRLRAWVVLLVLLVPQVVLLRG